MITSYLCVNISSKNPKSIVDFYHNTLGIPIIEFDENYDGVHLGFNKNAPSICIWDENKWGPSSEGKVNFVFKCDDLHKTYEALKDKVAGIAPPETAAWGGKELILNDPDGNKILLL